MYQIKLDKNRVKNTILQIQVMLRMSRSRVFGQNECEKGTLENLTVKVKTGLIQKMSVPKELEVEIRSFLLLGRMSVQKGLLG